MAKKTTKTEEKPQIQFGKVDKEEEKTKEIPLKEATVLEFTGKPNGKVEVFVEVEGKRKHIELYGKYEDFKIGQKLQI